MPSKTFKPGMVIDSDWLNDVNKVTYLRNQGFVSVTEFGAKGDGTTNDRAAIQAAFAASKKVYFPTGSYYTGTYASGEYIFDLAPYGEGISLMTDVDVEFVCQTTANVMPAFFHLANNSHFHCGPVKFRDTGYNPNITWHGAIGFSLDASTNWGNLIFDSIHSKNLVGSVIVSGGNSTTRIRGIKIGQLFSDDCYYGFNAQENGDGVVIDNLVAYQNYRPFYVYGVTDHKVKIFSRKNRATSAAVNISRSVLNTSGIDITYVARDQDQAITHVLINHVGLGGGEISNVRVNVDIQSSAVYAPVRFVNYTGSGGTETNAASLNRVYDITLEGSCDGQALQVTSVASYVDKGQLTFKHGQNFYPDATIFPLFRLGRVLRGYGVPWTSTGTAPVLGNGSCLVDTDLVDGIAVNTVKFLPGSTTTFGTGTWLFGLPYKASCAAVGSVWILDSGNAFFIGVAKIEAGDLTAQIFTNNAGTSASATSPFTWQNGDQMYFSIAYPVS